METFLWDAHGHGAGVELDTERHLALRRSHVLGLLVRHGESRSVAQPAVPLQHPQRRGYADGVQRCVVQVDGDVPATHRWRRWEEVHLDSRVLERVPQGICHPEVTRNCGPQPEGHAVAKIQPQILGPRLPALEDVVRDGLGQVQELNAQQRAVVGVHGDAPVRLADVDHGELYGLVAAGRELAHLVGDHPHVLEHALADGHVVVDAPDRDLPVWNLHPTPR